MCLAKLILSNDWSVETGLIDSVGEVNLKAKYQLLFSGKWKFDNIQNYENITCQQKMKLTYFNAKVHRS